MKLKRYMAALLALCALFSLAACAAPASGGAFTMDILDTGKSDCVILCMDGLVIVNDAADEVDYDTICAALEARGAERIDYLILSHYDKDHIGSAAALVRTYPVGQIIGPDYEEASVFMASLEKAAADRSVPFLRLTEDMTVETENGSFTADPPDMDYGDDNNNSLVTTVTWKGENLLLLGDAKKNRMTEQLAVSLGQYTLIKLPHHGDSNRPLLRLIAETHPRFAVATVSPAETVEEPLRAALAAAGTELFRTDGGAVHVVWDGSALAVSQEKK